MNAANKQHTVDESKQKRNKKHEFYSNLLAVFIRDFKISLLEYLFCSG